jgi:Reverse transcriptase (RNA-dependent DNA polymerase)
MPGYSTEAWAYSVTCWVYFTKHKDAATIRSIYEQWQRDAVNKANKPVSFLMTDGGGEYQAEMAKILKDSGTTHIQSPTYSPESNGLAERQNRILKDTARTMMKQANMPSSFWPKAVKAACDIRNRLPHSSLKGIRSPHRAFFKQEPAFHRFKIFGSLIFPHVPEERRPKQSTWNDRATLGVIVGYPSDTTYEHYDFTKQRFLVSHDLTIREGQFATAQDFDPSAPITATTTPPLRPESPKPIYDMIEVQRPPKILEFESHVAQKSTNENPTFEQAINSPDRNKWINAMQDEINSIHQNETWRLVKLPRGRKPIGVKRVLTVKRDTKGNIKKHKARLVAKGFSQQFGFDYDETYAPVVRIEHVRMLFAIAALFNLPVIHLDAKNAFLNGKSDFAIYISQPEGFIDIHFPDYVLLLLKSLYGLKQASRIWYLTLYEAIIDLGFTPSEFDPSIFISPERNMIIAIYVDDILAIGPQHACHEFANQLNQKFRIINQGPVSSFLGINVERKDRNILLNQVGYIDKLAQRFQIDASIPVPTPLEHSLPLVKPGENDKRADPTHYKELMGSLNHLATFTRPDISLAVSKLSQFNQDPTTAHLNAARHILKYAVSTKNFTIKYGGSTGAIQIDGYADADWGSDLTQRKSTTGYVFHDERWPHLMDLKETNNGCLINNGGGIHVSIRCLSRINRPRHLLPLCLDRYQTSYAFTDNKAAEAIVKREPDYQRSKHIDIRYHFIRDHYENGAFDVKQATRGHPHETTPSYQTSTHRTCAAT